MAPHMSDAELDRATALRSSGKTPVEVHALLHRARKARGQSGPDLTTVRRAIRGATRKRGRVETRGRKAKLTLVNLRALDAARRRLVKQAKGETEVHIEDVMKAARVTDVARSTVSKRFAEHLGVNWRTPREEPLRTAADMAERVDMCKKWKWLPNNFFTDRVDAIIDNKVFQIPTHARAKVHARKSRVRGHLRTRGEGLQPHFTKPKNNRHRVNPGATVNVAAAIVKGKIRVWHYLPKRWCADAACDFYSSVLAPSLRRNHSGKSSFLILEDNDPTGYKSNKAIECKSRPQRRLGRVPDGGDNCRPSSMRGGRWPDRADY